MRQLEIDDLATPPGMGELLTSLLVVVEKCGYVLRTMNQLDLERHIARIDLELGRYRPDPTQMVRVPVSPVWPFALGGLFFGASVFAAGVVFGAFLF